MTSFYIELYTIVEILNNLNFQVEHKKRRKVHYDQLKKHKTGEKSFAPEQKGKNSKWAEKIDLNSSDFDDKKEMESSKDSESNLNTENQSEAEDANDSLNVTNDTSENEAKESE